MAFFLKAFLNADSELRSGWKLLAFVSVLLPVWVATGFAVTLITTATYGNVDDLHRMALNAAISFAAAIAATLFAVLIVERLPLSAFGMGFHYGWTANVFGGIAIAAMLLASQMV